MAGAIPKIANSFISQLKGLMNECAKLAPDDHVIARTKKRLGLAADATPLLVVDWTGAAIFPYHASINSDNPGEWDKFLDPETKLFDGSFKESGASANQDDARHIISKVQDLVRPMPTEERRKYIERVRDLLDLYMDYREAKGE